MSISFAFLQPVWLILIFSGVVLLEACIYFLITKNKKISLQIAFIANIITTLVPIPMLLIPIFHRTAIMEFEGHLSVGGSDYYSLWLIPIILGFTLVKPLPSSPPYSYTVIPSDYFWTLISFVVACVISIIIEYYYYKSKNLDSTEVNNSRLSIFQQTTLANICSYTVILFGLITIGLFVGLSQEVDPLVGVSWLFYTLSDYNITIYLISIPTILVFLLVSYKIVNYTLQLGKNKFIFQKN